MPAPTRLDRETLTAQHLRAIEIALYQAADLINRLMASGGIPYTKMPVALPPEMEGM